MITLTAKINILGGGNGAISLGSNNLSGNNISSDLGNLIGVKNNASNPFLLGVSKLGDGSTLSDGVDYFIGNQSSNKEGIFANAYEITLTSTENFQSFSIAFDTANNRHPKSIYIDGVEYTDDDPIFTFGNLSNATSHTISITNWNEPNYPLVITGIYVGLEINIDYRNLISISRSIFDRSDLKLPSYGIISNVGDIEFNDNDGEVLDYAEQLLLQKGLSCEVYLNNTLVEGAKEKIGSFQTDQWNYENDSKVVSVSIKDDLEEWQDIYVEGISYDPRNTAEMPFSDLYKKLWGITNPLYQMRALSELGEETEMHLRRTYMKYPLLESGSLWQQWQKLCEACQLHIYKDSDGIISCRYNGGN